MLLSSRNTPLDESLLLAGDPLARAAMLSAITLPLAPVMEDEAEEGEDDDFDWDDDDEFGSEEDEDFEDDEAEFEDDDDFFDDDEGGDEDEDEEP